MSGRGERKRWGLKTGINILIGGNKIIEMGYRRAGHLFVHFTGGRLGVKWNSWLCVDVEGSVANLGNGESCFMGKKVGGIRPVFWVSRYGEAAKAYCGNLGNIGMITGEDRKIKKERGAFAWNG